MSWSWYDPLLLFVASLFSTSTETLFSVSFMLLYLPGGFLESCKFYSFSLLFFSGILVPADDWSETSSLSAVPSVVS